MQDVLYPTDGAGQATIGVDVSKNTLDLAGARGLPASIPNTVAACRKLARQLKKIGLRVVAVEATGGYERTLVQTLWDHDIPIAILQPSRVRAHAKSAGQLAKTDRLDAKNIAYFASSMEIRLAKRPSPEVEKLRTLRDRREQIVKDRVQEIGRLEAVHDASMRREICRQIKHLKKIETDLDRRIQALIDSVDALRSKSKILRSARGVGPVVAATLLCHLPELGSVNRQAIAALGGLAPFANESGKWRGRRSIFGGRAEVRRVLYMAAMTAASHEGPMRDRYLAMIARGKATKVAFIAIARKILVSLNAQMAEHLASCESPQSIPASSEKA